MNWSSLDIRRWVVYEADYTDALDEEGKPIPTKVNLFLWDNARKEEHLKMCLDAKKLRKKSERWRYFPMMLTVISESKL